MPLRPETPCVWRLVAHGATFAEIRVHLLPPLVPRRLKTRKRNQIAGSPAVPQPSSPSRLTSAKIMVRTLHMLSCFVLTPPPRPHGMVPLDPGPWHNIPPLGYSRLFPHLVEFLANTMQFNTTCKDYDSINQHSHQSTRTTGPQGGRGQTMTMPKGGRSDAGAYIRNLAYSIKTCKMIIYSHTPLY